MRIWKHLTVSLCLAVALMFGGCSSNKETSKTGNTETTEESVLDSKTRVANAKAALEEGDEELKEGVAVEEFDLEDGVYTMEVALFGGSGRATVESPAEITVADGKVTATIVWSSPYYDYMLLDGEKYMPVNTEGNSTFELPVSVLDGHIAVTGDTTAMSEPHEIDYKLCFDSSTLSAN